MYYEAHVRFVDTHAESYGSYHHLSFIFYETLLALVAFHGGKARVIGLSVYPFLNEVRRDRLGARAR